jgi:hypothetical protein
MASGGPLEGSGIQVLSREDVERRLDRMRSSLPTGHVSCIVGRQLAHLFDDVVAVVCGSIHKVGDAQVEIRPTI